MAAPNENLFSLDKEKEEFLRQATRAATLTVLALESMGGESPDDEQTNAVFAASLDLPNAEAYCLVRDQMVKLGWAMQLETESGPRLRLTSLGQDQCEMLKKGMEARLARERAEQSADKPETETDQPAPADVD